MKIHYHKIYVHFDSSIKRNFNTGKIFDIAKYWGTVDKWLYGKIYHEICEDDIYGSIVTTGYLLIYKFKEHSVGYKNSKHGCINQWWESPALSQLTPVKNCRILK